MLLFLLTGACSVFAQNLEELQKNLRWNKGNLTLSTEEYFVGEIRYDETMGFVSFRTDETSDDKRAFQIAEILRMEYRDTDEKLRKFYSLAFTHDEIGYEEICFYEVIAAFEDFTVLSTRDRQTTHHTQLFYGTMNSTTIAQSLQNERFYFLDKTGKSKLYITIVYRKVKGDFYKARGDSGKILNDTLFPTYLGKHWPAVEKYARENWLNLNNRQGIVGVLDYYSELLKQEE